MDEQSCADNSDNCLPPPLSTMVFYSSVKKRVHKPPDLGKDPSEDNDIKEPVVSEKQGSGLKIWLEFKKYFKEESLSEMIEEEFEKFPDAHLVVDFDETELLPKKNITNCYFTVSSDTISTAISTFKKVVTRLKERLKERIIYDYKIIYSTAPENCEKNADIPLNTTVLKNGEEKAYTPLNSRVKQQSLKKDIRKAIKDIEEQSISILHCHDKKINDIKKSIEIEINPSNENYLELLDDKEFSDQSVLSQKLQELEMQRSEFVQRKGDLCKALVDLDLSIAKSEDISIVLKSVGVECNRLKNALPIYARRKDIIDQVRSNQVSVILGETGSGKSTQLAQYLYEAGFSEDRSIICTQPRRIAAITLAERVASEMVESVGKMIGYKVGTGKKKTAETKLFFTTDHSLLNECLKDPELSDYSCIIVDEAHERSIYTDILLGMIKICLQKRSDLKVIITSATIDPEVFIKYFNSGPELRVSGRTFPVDLYYHENAHDDFENYEEKAVSKALKVHCSEDPGDILVFLCSPVEINRCCDEFVKRCQGRNDFKCLPLHGQLAPEEQKKVFEKLSPEIRKVVFATNCAETSITIDGIKYVIDTGVAKEMKYDPKRNMNQLGVHAISKSSANQRKGRAGRTASGKCFRLYTKDSYDSMESLSDPEILRVHLGKAVLKLSELGVDIKSYDFVQAPSETALNSAIDTLNYLGAIHDNQITNIGRWISKLPFDPKLGYVVYEAAQLDILFDAVVLVSVISSGSDLFFRGFTESEAQTVAKSKISFGSQHGDTFTWLQVYKSWVSEEDNKKEWCKKHCINNKCIHFVRQSIKDVKTILSKELKIEMREEFSTENNDMDKLRKILFKANADSISNFSGVARAGYFSIIPERQVHIHPSSIVMALNIHPEWVVYTNLVRTSREFIKGITVIEEEWVKELVEAGKLFVDITKAKENKFNNVHHEEVGSSIFRALVGPFFSNIRTLEEDLVNSGLLRSVVEVTRDLGVLDIFSPFTMSQFAIDKLNAVKSSTAEKLLSEDFEFPLNKKESIISSGTRVVLGKGGCVKNVFMPNQSDKVIVKRIHPSVTEEDILNKFKVFGEIKDIIQFKSYDPWGFVRYSSTAEALFAVEATCKDEYNAGMLKLDKHAKNAKNMFEAKITWIRRPIKGKGTAFIKCSPLVQPQLVGHSIWVLGNSSTIKVSNRGDLIIFNTGSLLEDEIKDKIINLMSNLGICPASANLEVSISREVVTDTDNELKSKADAIRSYIKRYVSEDNFKVSMLGPKKGSIYYVCFASFVDPVRGYEVCKRIRSGVTINGQLMDVSPCLKTTVMVPLKLKVACEERFEKLFSGLAKYRRTELNWKELKKDFAIEIKATRPEDIVEARDLLCKEMEGEVIDCSINKILSCLLNKVGQDHLKDIEKKTGCVIITDFRSNKVHLYGTEAKISKAQQDINSYLTEIDGSEQNLVQMKGNDKPPGLMKLAMRKYGPFLDGLVDEFKLKSINVNWKKHNIQLIGPKTAVEQALISLSTLEEEAWRDVGTRAETSLPDCSVCFCPIEKKEFLFRLEVCGHAYCLDCLKHQTSHSVNNKEFPLACVKDECESPFVWKDMKFALSKKWIREDKLVSMAVNDFVSKNKDKYKFCITPNCPVIYEVTEEESGCEFNCPLCLASICTTCNIGFHAGLTCLMAKSGNKADTELADWVKKDSNKRCLCPGCKNPIEKIEGCNKMHCTICNTYFCWVCLHVSPTEDKCYKHLRENHNGYFGN